MKTTQASFFLSSAILAALFAACPNPVAPGGPADQRSDLSGASVAPEGGKAAGGKAASIPDTGGFTVTIPVGAESGRAAGLSPGTIRGGGGVNTFMLAVLNTHTGKVAFSQGRDRTGDADLAAEVAIRLSPGAYSFLLLAGHRERDYTGETEGGPYRYKAGKPTLLYAGFTSANIAASGAEAVTITMKPLTVTAEFTSKTLGASSVPADTGVVPLAAAEDWTLTWKLGGGGPGQLKAAQG